MGWALVGCGSAGKSHAQWASSTPGIVIRGFCDTQADAARRFHEECGGEYHTTDPERIFTDPLVDIVSIATSHSSHADLAVAAFQAKKHLFLEKPMAMTTADCLRIYEAMKLAGTKLMLDFSIRFSGATQAIKRRLKASKVSHGQCMVARADLRAGGNGTLQKGEDRFMMLEFMPWISSVGCMIQIQSKSMRLGARLPITTN